MNRLTILNLEIVKGVIALSAMLFILGNFGHLHTIAVAFSFMSLFMICGLFFDIKTKIQQAKVTKNG